MFAKVLIAEDIDSIGLDKVLNGLGITAVEYVKYCDDALLRVKRARLDQQPFDLLITDLSFKGDHREVKIPSGEKLIPLIRLEQPDLKIIVYSIEERPYAIRHLFERHGINAFVGKGRKSLDQVRDAVNSILRDEVYISPELAHILKDRAIHEIDNYDIQLIRELSNGVQQEHMEARFRELGITPNSKSSIEKRIGRLKDYFRANNTVHLIAIAKDLGIG